MIERGRKAIGSKTGVAKLTEKDVPEIIAMHNYGISNIDISKKFNVADGTIAYVLKKGWRHATGNVKVRNLDYTEIRKTKLTVGEVIDIRKLYASEKCSLSFLARKYGVCVSTISRIVKNQSWKKVIPSTPLLGI